MPRDVESDSGNPPFHAPLIGEAGGREALRAADYAWYKNAGDLGTYYNLYPLDRSPNWGVEPEDLPPEERRRLGVSIESDTKPTTGSKTLSFFDMRYPNRDRAQDRDR